MDRLLRGAGDSSGYPMGSKRNNRNCIIPPKDCPYRLLINQPYPTRPKAEIKRPQHNVFNGNRHIEGNSLSELVETQRLHPIGPLKDDIDNSVFHSPYPAKVLKTRNTPFKYPPISAQQTKTTGACAMNDWS